MMERRKFLKMLACVPAAPALLKGMDWAAFEPAEAAQRGLGRYSASVPPGTIMPFAGTEIPPGFLACDGRAIPRFAYRKLYDAIGPAFGTRQRFRVQHFCVPDFRASARPAAALAHEEEYGLGHPWSYVIRT